MTESMNYPLLILLWGAVISLAVFTKSLMERSSIPPLLGFLLLGLLLRVCADSAIHMPDGWEQMLTFFSKIGLVTLLFRIGLESNPKKLFAELKTASVVGISDVTLNMIFGFTLVYYILGFSLTAGLVAAVAFAATSVGVSVTSWDNANALKSKNGALLLDVAELDDIAAILLLAVLFAILPLSTLESQGQSAVLGTLGSLALLLGKLSIFSLACYFFSQYAADPLTRFLTTHEHSPHPVLIISGFGLVIAAMAGWLGFSLAIGAFFAGLVFSPEARELDVEHGFTPIYELFSPFFFIGIGYAMSPGSLLGAVPVGLALFAVACIAKIVAAGGPVALMKNWNSGLLIGVSMIPRAEISLVVAHKAREMSDAITPQLFSALVFMSAGTCLLGPLVVKKLLERWPQQEIKEGAA